MSNSGDKQDAENRNQNLPSYVKNPTPGIKDVDMILGELTTVSPNSNYAAFLLNLVRAKNADEASAENRNQSRLSSVIKDVDMILGEPSSSTVSTNRNYTAFELSLERGKNADVASADQAAIYYIGGICCLMPEVTDDVLEGFRQKGWRVRIVRVPESDDVAISRQKKANAYFGWLVTMLYKNTNEGLANVITDPDFKAPFDVAGYVPLRGEAAYVLSLFDYLKLPCYLGHAQLGRIKESVLKGILNHKKDGGSFGDVCSYVSKALSWKYMTGFYNVYKTLVLSDSPVLKFHGLAHEIENLHRAFKAVSGSEMPRFFRILVDGSKYHLVDRRMFPTLVAVSEQIMRTAGGSRLSDEDFLVAMHRNQFVDAVKAHELQFVNDRR
ncbi:hypothetical protein IGI04_000618 [Brassica rapa subsp. trilocularis]|uniref:Uncharacterized protein n=1 Tax=Brassica rapa subsp. trilocularis TaxID=1813537 RepID=A0ABQ7NRA0_BRACM|nr:hypothetical protein IGI04_000618 [Brassica rapa subsp. trilocularis]